MQQNMHGVPEGANPTCRKNVITPDIKHGCAVRKQPQSTDCARLTLALVCHPDAQVIASTASGESGGLVASSKPAVDIAHADIDYASDSFTTEEYHYMCTVADKMSADRKGLKKMDRTGVRSGLPFEREQECVVCNPEPIREPN